MTAASSCRSSVFLGLAERGDCDAIESRDAVAFGPERDAAWLRQSFVEAGEYPGPVERDDELIVLGPNCQVMPGVRSDIRIDGDDLFGYAVAHEREKDSIPQRIQLDEVVV